MSVFPLDEYLEREGRAIEETLRLRLAHTASQLDRSGDLDLRVLEAGVFSGGKRIRPILCVTGYRAVAGLDGNAPLPEAAYDLAVSLEFVHAYSLMHDDLPCMDNADLRRGVPTPHTQFGVEATVRAGAALIPAAAWSAWEAGTRLGGDALGRRAAGLLMEAAGARGMVGGQAVDLASEGQRLDETALTALHGLKTGALLGASLEIGAVAAGADTQVLEGLRGYGTAIGLAFQIADDCLDRTGTSESLGKNPSDEAFDKSTYVGLLGVDGALGRGAEQVRGAKTALTDAGIESTVLEALADYILLRAR